MQKVLDNCLTEISSAQYFLPLLLGQVAEDLNFNLSAHEIERLSESIQNSKDNSLLLDLDLPCTLGTTEEEVQNALQMIIDALAERFPEVQEKLESAISRIVPETLAKVAEDVGAHLSEKTLEHSQELKKLHADRVASVVELWGPAIEQLDILRHLVLEWSLAASELRKGSYTNSNTAFALQKLVERAYEIVGEILVLVRAGYADGALARWRSLHEVCVITMFLAHKSDRCSQMYLAHHWVEELRLLEVDKTSGTSHIANPHKDRYTSDLRLKAASLSSKFGENFSGDYGWAAVELGRNRTTFRDLETEVGLETLRRGYRKANSTVHGGALATLTRVSIGVKTTQATELPPAHGCEVAANYVTASLSMMVAELCLEAEDADLVTMNMVIQNQAIKIWNNLDRVKDTITGNSPRAKILSRKAMQQVSRIGSKRR